MRLALLLLASIGAVTAGCDSGKPAPPVAPPEPSVAAPAAMHALPDPAKRSAATLSAYAYARIAEGSPPPSNPSDSPALRPMPLDQAAQILRADDSPFGNWRREQAIVRLAAVGLHDPAIRAALTTLGANLAQIEAILASNPGADHAERVIALGNALLEAIDGCKPTDVFSGVSKAGGGGTFAKVTFDVNRDLASLARIMDPQNWDLDSEICGDYFEAAYIAKKSGDGYEHDADGNVEEAIPGEPIANDWLNVLFEYYAYSTTPTESTWFKNLLDVTSDRAPDTVPPPPLPPTSYRVDYDLHQSIRSQVGTDVRDGGIEVDHGYALAQVLSGGAGVSVEATKELLLSERPGAVPALDTDLLNWWASVYLTAMGDAIARQACCPLPPTTPEPPALVPP